MTEGATGLFRKRERFDRIDVPRDSPYRNVIGVVVCAAALSLTALVVLTVWNRVNLESRLEDRGLESAVGGQSSTYVPDGGYVATEDDVETLLLLVTSSLDEGAGAALDSAHVVVMNRTAGTGVDALVPNETKVSVGDSSSTLADLFQASGYEEVVAPLAKSLNVRFDHVIVATENVLPEVAGLSGVQVGSLLGEGADLLVKMRTDLGADSLVSLASTLSGIGVSSLAQVTVSLYPETATDEEGAAYETGFLVPDRAELGTQLGLLAAA